MSHSCCRTQEDLPYLHLRWLVWSLNRWEWLLFPPAISMREQNWAFSREQKKTAYPSLSNMPGKARANPESERVRPQSEVTQLPKMWAQVPSDSRLCHSLEGHRHKKLHRWPVAMKTETGQWVPECPPDIPPGITEGTLSSAGRWHIPCFSHASFPAALQFQKRRKLLQHLATASKKSSFPLWGVIPMMCL